MGNNSSEIRVAPFGKLLVKDHSNVSKLLHLVKCSNVNFGTFSNDDIFFAGNNANKNNTGEMALKPPQEHLKSIIDLIYCDENAREYFKKAVEKSHVSAKENRLKMAGREYYIEDIYKAIENNEKWAILEGTSKPDLFIESDRFILIIEGKLTEPHTTTKTTYLMSRNQMLRHIQGAIEHNRQNNQNKKIIAFYIVPETFSQIEEIKKGDKFVDILEKESVRISDHKYIDLITSSYYGYTTWEKVEKKFNIAFRAIIE